MSSLISILINTTIQVLILIILEVLYEQAKANSTITFSVVLILIILEVLYELHIIMDKIIWSDGLNPYYTGSTL